MNENMNAYVIIKYILLQQNWKTIKNSEAAELKLNGKRKVRMYENVRSTKSTNVRMY